MKKLRTALKTIGLVMLLSFYIMFFYTFLNAYLNPNKEFTFHVNRQGEANFEFILFVLTTPCVCYTVYKMFTKNFLVEEG